MKHRKLKITMFLTGLVPIMAAAHAGHHHASAEEETMHTGLIVAGILVLAVAGFVVKKVTSTQEKREHVLDSI